MGRGACERGRRGAHADGGRAYMHAEGDVRAREREGGCITIPFPSLFACAPAPPCARPASLPVRVHACPAVCAPPPSPFVCVPVPPCAPPSCPDVCTPFLPVRMRACPVVCMPPPLPGSCTPPPPSRLRARAPPLPVRMRTPPTRPPPPLPVCVRALPSLFACAHPPPPPRAPTPLCARPPPLTRMRTPLPVRMHTPLLSMLPPLCTGVRWGAQRWGAPGEGGATRMRGEGEVEGRG
jgi:hypothetical protein